MSRSRIPVAVMTSPLHREKYRATPFAADADPLNHAQKGQNNRTPDADRLVGGYKGDQERRDPHAQECRNQCRFTPDTIAVMPEYRRADRTPDEPDEISTKSRQCPG